MDDVSAMPYHSPSSVDTMGAMAQLGDHAPPGAVEPARWERAAALFLRWRDGDSRAMDELVRLMTPTLWHVARSYGLDAAVAQDVVQTTWLTLVRRHESIIDPQAVSGWLTMCARREAWRVGKLHRRADATEPDAIETHLPVHESAEQIVVADDDCRRLWHAVALLNERCQRLLRIVAFADRPDYAAISQDLGMPIGSIGPTRQRCLAKLRASLEGDGWGGDDPDGG